MTFDMKINYETQETKKIEESVFPLIKSEVFHKRIESCFVLYGKHGRKRTISGWEDGIWMEDGWESETAYNIDSDFASIIFERPVLLSNMTMKFSRGRIVSKTAWYNSGKLEYKYYSVPNEARTELYYENGDLKFEKIRYEQRSYNVERLFDEEGKLTTWVKNTSYIIQRTDYEYFPSGKVSKSTYEKKILEDDYYRGEVWEQYSKSEITYHINGRIFIKKTWKSGGPDAEVSVFDRDGIKLLSCWLIGDEIKYVTYE